MNHSQRTKEIGLPATTIAFLSLASSAELLRDKKTGSALIPGIMRSLVEAARRYRCLQEPAAHR